MESDSTITIPILEQGHDLTEVHLPQYYRESYFSGDSLLHPELGGGRYGVAGDPVPYTISGDPVISLVLLACFIVALPAYAASRHYLVPQLKDYFRTKRVELPGESPKLHRGLIVFLLQTCVLQALLYFFYVRNEVADTFIVADEYQLAAIFLGVIVVHYVLRYLIYTGVNLTFFDGKRNLQWIAAHLLTIGVGGVLLFPIVILYAFFDVSPESVLYYFTIVTILVKISLFYKSYTIFFRQNGLYLQNILYFCSLEIVPFVALGGGLAIIVNALKINF